MHIFTQMQLENNYIEVYTVYWIIQCVILQLCFSLSIYF